MKKIRYMIMLLIIESILNADNFSKNQIACNNGDMKGCHNIGYMYDTGDGVKEDNEKAVQFYGKSCHHGFAPSCYNSGLIYLYEIGNIKLGKWLFAKACKGGMIKGCNWYDRLDREGY